MPKFEWATPSILTYTRDGQARSVDELRWPKLGTIRRSNPTHEQLPEASVLLTLFDSDKDSTGLFLMDESKPIDATPQVQAHLDYFKSRVTTECDACPGRPYATLPPGVYLPVPKNTFPDPLAPQEVVFTLRADRQTGEFSYTQDGSRYVIEYFMTWPLFEDAESDCSETCSIQSKPAPRKAWLLGAVVLFVGLRRRKTSGAANG